MDIAAMSMGISQVQIAQEVNTSVMKIAMDSGEEQMQEMVKMMEQSVNPHIGGSLDLRL